MSTPEALLGWPELLEHLALSARTAAGARAARTLPLAADAAEARARYAAVAEVQLLEAGDERVPVGAVGDIGELVERAGRGTVLEAADLRSVGSSLDGLRWLRRWGSEHADSAPLVWGAAVAIDVDEPLCERLRRSFDSAGELSGEEYPVLGELRRRVTALKGRIRTTLDDLLRGDALAGLLQDRYVTERNGRYVLPVKSSFRKGLGIVHGTSQSGETVYVEPAAVVEVHNDLKEAEAALAHEEHRILGELSRAVAARRRPILASLECAVRIDLVCARAGLGDKLAGIVPTVGDEGVLVAHAARHPGLVLAGVEVIPNDLQLTPEQPGLVLTGPNAGGKTIALKTIGLLALLVRAGVPLPCTKGSRVDVFAPLLAEMGDQQSVADGLSTFSAHVKGLGEALAAARPGALVLIDEITSGTDPAQGAALARSVLESLVAAGARVAVTTHFPELKTLPAADPRFGVSAAEFAEGRPTFRIQAGVPGPSHALAIARRMGLSEAVLDRAAEVMDHHAREIAQRLEKLDEERALARKLARQAEERLAAAAERERSLAEAEARLRARVDRLVAEAGEAHRARLRAVEEEVRALVAALQANPTLKDANAALTTIRATRAPAVEVEPPAEAAPYVPKVGEKVRVRTLNGQIGRVAAVAADGRVEVELGRLLRSWLPAGAVEAMGRKEQRAAERKEHAAERKEHGAEVRKEYARAAEARQEPPRRARSDRDPDSRPAAVRIGANTVDLRGLRVDEATARTEAFFDEVSLGGLRTTFVLHGHGTGALKTAIRAWLGSCRYVKTWRPADADEGGDAYTVVELR